MVRRIIPVASGKGGVGKTTFAMNFALALSRVGPTVLVDLDTGTSSVRNTLSVPVRRDLYHFQRKATPLADCITLLDPAHDPHGHFSRFGFIAGPKHFIEGLSNPDETFRRTVAAAINRLPADYVVVDLRAGLDRQVLDFLPYTNSGVLVFAPNHPAATVAASDIVKAILFRSLKVLFGPGSKLFEKPELGRHHALIHELLERTEDVYDDSLPNLDAFLVALEDGIGRHPILGAIAANLEGFHVHYVLNMFDGVEESHRDAVTPFVKNLTEHVSSRLHLSQLGWIVQDDRIHESNRTGYPILLQDVEADTPPVDPVLAELEEIESSALGFRRPGAQRSEARRSGSFRLPSNPQSVASMVVPTEDLLAAELEALGSMYRSRKSDTVHENFAYLVHRALGLMAPPMAKSDFGMTSLAPVEELTDWFLRWQRAFGG